MSCQAGEGALPRWRLTGVPTVLHTLTKRQVDVVAHLKGVLDQLAIDTHQDPFLLLFPTGPT